MIVAWISSHYWYWKGVGVLHDLILTTIQLRERKIPIQMEVDIRPKYTCNKMLSKSHCNKKLSIPHSLKISADWSFSEVARSWSKTFFDHAWHHRTIKFKICIVCTLNHQEYLRPLNAPSPEHDVPHGLGNFQYPIKHLKIGSGIMWTHLTCECVWKKLGDILQSWRHPLQRPEYATQQKVGIERPDWELHCHCL